MTGTSRPVGPGERAPALRLPDVDGDSVDLATITGEGRHALVVFFPFAFSPLCTGELLEIQLNIDEFVNDRVQVLAVSCDPPRALKAWAAREGYRFPLLSDFWPHGAAASDWGVLDVEHGMPVRGTFLVSPEGLVTWSLVQPPGAAREIGDLHRAVRAAGTMGAPGL